MISLEFTQILSTCSESFEKLLEDLQQKETRHRDYNQGSKGGLDIILKCGIDSLFPNTYQRQRLVGATFHKPNSLSTVIFVLV